MGHPTKVQLIQRQESTQWYVNFPAAVARALELEKGEVVEWVIQDKHHLVLKRVEAAKAVAPRRGEKNYDGKTNWRPDASNSRPRKHLRSKTSSPGCCSG